MGKGSVPRPFDVPHEQFTNNWDKIFGKKDPKEEKPKDENTNSNADTNDTNTKTN